MTDAYTITVDRGWGDVSTLTVEDEFDARSYYEVVCARGDDGADEAFVVTLDGPGVEEAAIY